MTEKEEIGSKSISFRATKEDMVIIRRFQEREEKAGIRKATEADVLRRGLRLVDEGITNRAGEPVSEHVAENNKEAILNYIDWHTNGLGDRNTEQNRTEQNRTEQNRTEQNRTEEKRTEQNRTEQNRTE